MNNDAVLSKDMDGLFYVGLQIKKLAFSMEDVMKDIRHYRSAAKISEKIEIWEKMLKLEKKFKKIFVELYEKKFGEYPKHNVKVSDITSHYYNDREIKRICVDFGYGYTLYNSAEALFNDISETYTKISMRNDNFDNGGIY